MVTECYSNSFVEVADLNSENMLLEEDADLQNELGIFLHPGMTVNNITYRGYLEGDDVKDAICSSFVKQPKVCRNQIETFFEDIIEELEYYQEAEVEAERMSDDSSRRVHKYIVWAILGFILASQIVFFCLYRKKKQGELNNRMRSSVDQAIVEYMRVNNTLDGEQSSEANRSETVNSSAAK